MNTSLVLSKDDEKILEVINSTNNNWFEMSVENHPIFSQFSRKLVVTGFSNPDLSSPEERIYVYINQVLTLKQTNEVYKTIPMKSWEIYEWNMETALRPDGTPMTGIRTILDDEGNIIEEKEEIVKVPSIQYVRFLIKSKSLHLTDVLSRFMVQYIEKFKKDIDNI